MGEDGYKIPDYIRQFVQSNTYSAVIAVMNGVCVDCNDLMCRLLGCADPSEVIGRNIREFIHPNSLLEFESRREKVLSGELVPTCQIYKIARKDGTVGFAEVEIVYVDPESNLIVSVGHDATEREAEMSAFRSRFECFVNSTQDLLWEMDAEGRFTYMSPSIRRFGYAPEEWIGHKITEFLPPEERAAFQQRLKEDIVKMAPKVYEVRMYRKDYSIAWMEVSVGYKTEDDRLICLQGIARDITERKQAEEDLRIREERYRSLIDAQSDIILRFAANGTISFINPAGCRVYGVREGDILGKNWRVLIHPDDLERVREAFMKVLSPPYRVSDECRVQTAEGVRWMHWEASAILDDDGHPAEIQAVGRDVTDRKKAEDALARSEYRLRALLSAIPDLLFVLNQSGTVIEFVPTSYVTRFVNPRDYVGRNINEIFRPEIAEVAMRCLKEAFETGEQQTCDYNMPVEGLDLDFECCFIPISDTEALAVIRDITERKREANRLRQMNEELERAYQMQQVFLGNVSHEIRTPLTAIRGYVEMMEDLVVGPLNQEQKTLLGKILDSCEDMLRMIEGLLEISRLRRGRLVVKPRVCVPSDSLKKAVAMAKLLAEQKEIDIKLNINGGEKTGVYDEEKLSTIFSNLLTNAVKFTEKGGEVTASLEYTEDGFTAVIADTGVGIPEDKIETIFEEFSQLETPRKGKSRGFGLGLSIVRALVELLGAELTVSSVVGLGTAFTVYIPSLDTSHGHDGGKNA